MLPKSEALVAFEHIHLPNSRDFLFHLFPQQYLNLYSHFLDYTNVKILMHNNVDHTIQISSYHQLGCVTKLLYESYFAALADFDVASTAPISPTIFHEHNKISTPLAGDLETELSNSIKIYKDKKVVDVITRLINEYPSI